jgi:hypothetical protein
MWLLRARRRRGTARTTTEVLQLGYASYDRDTAEEYQAHGVTALQLACMHGGEPDVVRALLRRALPGSDPNRGPAHFIR